MHHSGFGSRLESLHTDATHRNRLEGFTYSQVPRGLRNNEIQAAGRKKMCSLLMCAAPSCQGAHNAYLFITFCSSAHIPYRRNMSLCTDSGARLPRPRGRDGAQATISSRKSQKHGRICTDFFHLFLTNLVTPSCGDVTADTRVTSNGRLARCIKGV